MASSCSIPRTFHVSSFKWASGHVKDELVTGVMTASSRRDTEAATGPKNTKKKTTVKKKNQQIKQATKKRKRSRAKTMTAPRKKRSCDDDDVLVTRQNRREVATNMTYQDVHIVVNGPWKMRVPRRQNRRNSSILVIVAPEDLDEERKNLYDSLVADFAKTPGYIENTVFRFAEEMHPLSLHILNFAVTTYGPQMGITYLVDTHNPGTIVEEPYPDEFIFDPERYISVSLAADYGYELERFGKDLFAPCRRHDRLPWLLEDGTTWITTLAQVCFFRWVQKICLVEYCEIHEKEIQPVMDLDKEERKKRSLLRKKFKRGEIGDSKPRELQSVRKTREEQIMTTNRAFTCRPTILASLERFEKHLVEMMEEKQ
jgi:hypothetical protein